MLKILPIQSKTEQEAVCARCGVIYNEDLLAYSAELDGVLSGVCQFRTDSDGGHIIDLAASSENENEEVLFVLGRAALNFIDLTGVHKAYFDANGLDERLIRRIGFKKLDNGKFFVDLTNFFCEPCKHDAN